MTRNSWRAGRRYVLALLSLGLPLLFTRGRGGRLAARGAIGAAGAVALFFRDPERRLVPETDTVYAAADGIVASVERAVEDPWLPGTPACRISVFLSLHNVHVNRAPVAGLITDVQELGGGFAPALFSRAVDNRRTRIAVDSDRGRVVVVQIAGLIARTISTWVRVGDSVAPGQRLGMIHFGSRTDVLLSAAGADVLVGVGARVRAGVTPLARLLPEEQAS